MPDPSLPLAILSGPFLDDLLAQPAAISATLAALPLESVFAQIARELHRRTIDRVVLTGMGSSLHALLPLQLNLHRAGYFSLVIETAELVHTQQSLLTPTTLLVIVSQSGRSAETVRLLEVVRERSALAQGLRVIAVTNTADSPLAQQVKTVILLHAGKEFSVSCKTYLATLVALEWLGGMLVGRDLVALRSILATTAEAVATYLSDWKQHVAQVPAEISGAAHLFITGRGRSLAAVGTGALILKESVRIHAEGMSSPAFRHGPLEMVSRDMAVIIFAGEAPTTALNEQLARDIHAIGGASFVIGNSSELGVFRLAPVEPALQPVMEMLPLQMISLAIAHRQNREPGRFERATKITATE